MNKILNKLVAITFICTSSICSASLDHIDIGFGLAVPFGIISDEINTIKENHHDRKYDNKLIKNTTVGNDRRLLERTVAPDSISSQNSEKSVQKLEI